MVARNRRLMREEIVAELGPTDEYSHVCDVCDKRINQVGDKFIINHTPITHEDYDKRKFITCKHINNE